jgi:hypothetical protein
MTILARYASNNRIIGQINTDYSSLGVFGSARTLNVYSSIASDISSSIASSDLVAVNWQVIFAFSAFPTYPQENKSALPSADFGSWSTARFGQQTANGDIKFQCMVSPTFGYFYGTGSATYPRGRYNLPNVGTVTFVEARNVGNQQVVCTTADIMYITSEFAENAVTLQLQIQYFMTKIALSASSRGTLDF